MNDFRSQQEIWYWVATGGKMICDELDGLVVWFKFGVQYDYKNDKPLLTQQSFSSPDKWKKYNAY